MNKVNYKNFEDFLKDLNNESRYVRKASFMFEKEILKYLNITLEQLDDMSINEIKNSLLQKRDNKNII